MNKTETMDLFNLEQTADAAQIDARYKQIDAFFNAHTESSDAVLSLAKQTRTALAQYYAALPKPAQSSKPTDGKTDSGTKSDTGKSPTWLFPHPVEKAGDPFSDQWWRVYKRAVLVGLAVIGFVLYEGPRILAELQPAPTQTPTYLPYNPGPTNPPPSTNTSPFAPIGPPPGN